MIQNKLRTFTHLKNHSRSGTDIKSTWMTAVASYSGIVGAHSGICKAITAGLVTKYLLKRSTAYLKNHTGTSQEHRQAASRTVQTFRSIYTTIVLYKLNYKNKERIKQIKQCFPISSGWRSGQPQVLITTTPCGQADHLEGHQGHTTHTHTHTHTRNNSP